jgi:hypothetical protein
MAQDGLEKIVGNAMFSTLHRSLSNGSYTYAAFVAEGGAEGEIDPASIDTLVLDEALDLARKHGVYTAESKKLLKTARLVRSLREAMKTEDWSAVEEILLAANIITSRMGEVPSGAIKGLSALQAPKITKDLRARIDRVAEKEILLITSQLELRSAMVEITRALRVGRAVVQNGIVDTSKLAIDALLRVIERATRHVNAPPSPAQESAVGSGPGHSPLSSAASSAVATPAKLRPSSKLRKQIELLVDSATAVLAARSALMRKSFQEAADMAQAALSLVPPPHPSVMEELQLYAIDISQTLSVRRLCQSLRESAAEGRVEALSQHIARAREGETGASIFEDLGLVMLLHRAQDDLRSLNEAQEDLIKAKGSFDPAFVKECCRRGRELSVDPSLVDALVERAAALDRLEQEAAAPGALSDREGLEAVRRAAISLGLEQHPLLAVIDTTLQLPKDALRTRLVAQAVAKGSAAEAATETIRCKRRLLGLTGMAMRFRLEHFPRLRQNGDFFESRAPSAQSSPMPAKGQMALGSPVLRHTDLDIHSSLTRLPPALSALSVWIFSHCVQGVERELYTRPEVHIRFAVHICQCCPSMRDEVILQIVMQIRDNPVHAAATRLWVMLCTCLRHFPCSALLENFVELFLYKHIKRSEMYPADHRPQHQQLHQQHGHHQHHHNHHCDFRRGHHHNC